MALNLGLILGSALAGAAAGGGDAAEKMGQEEQKQQGQQDLVRLQNQLDEQKQMRIQEAEHTFQNQYQSQGFAHQDKSQAASQQFEGTQNDLNRQNQKEISAGNNATSIMVANISSQTSKDVEAMRASAQKEIQNLASKGVNLVQDKDGQYVSVDRVTGQTTPIMVNGQPLIGAKNVDSATAMAAAALLKPDPTDDPADAKRKQDQAYKMLGIDPNKGAPGPAPSAKALAALKADPTLAPAFDQKFGAGASARVLGTPTPTDAGATTGLPGTGDPGAGTNNPALINGNLPAAAAAAATQPYTARNPRPTAAAPAVASNPAPAPYQPSALIASAMTPQNGPPPTQPAFKQQLDAFGRPIQQNTVQNQIGL